MSNELCGDKIGVYLAQLRKLEEGRMRERESGGDRMDHSKKEQKSSEEEVKDEEVERGYDGEAWNGLVAWLTGMIRIGVDHRITHFVPSIPRRRDAA